MLVHVYSSRLLWRLRQEDHLSIGVQGQPEQRSETLMVVVVLVEESEQNRNSAESNA